MPRSPYFRKISASNSSLIIVSGRPSPNLLWLVNGIPVSDSASVTVLKRRKQNSVNSMATSDSGLVVSSSLMVGTVQRRNVDSTYTCLASNSNMTQASRAAVELQMNRKFVICWIRFKLKVCEITGKSFVAAHGEFCVFSFVALTGAPRRVQFRSCLYSIPSSSSYVALSGPNPISDRGPRSTWAT